MKHKIGIFHLTMIGISGIVGSGWLFASMYAAHYAGSGAYFAWIGGALLMLLFCLCLSELVSLYPKRGLLASICSFSHNNDFAFLTGIANWVGTVAIIPTEALATVRYLNWPHWTLFALIGVYALLNTWGVKLFARFNSLLTVFKFIIPVLTVIILFACTSKHASVHPVMHFNLHQVLQAIIAGGIIYGFNGVQMIVNFTGEAKKPKRDVPIALFAALSLGLALYIGLQAAFLHSANLTINYQSPFLQLVATLNIAWMVILLQVGAVVSPSGAGFSFIASSTRMLTSMSEVGQLPRFFAKLHPKYHISHRSLLANTVLSIAFFFIFKTWIALVVVVSSFHLLSYLAGPLALTKLRKTMPTEKRIFKMPMAWLLAPLLFVVITVLFTMAGMHNNIMVTTICIIIQAIYLLINYRGAELWAGAKRSWFLPAWLIVLTLIASFGTNLYAAVIAGLVFYFIGTRANA